MKALRQPSGTGVKGRSRATLAVAVVGASLGVGALAGPWATFAWGRSATPVDHDLAIAVRQYTQGLTPLADFFGHVPTRSSGELVEILERDCGDRFDRIVTGTQSGRGGLWVKEGVFAGGSKYWVARWNGRYSERLLIRQELRPGVYRLPARRAWTVVLYTSKQSMRGRVVVLQRQTSLGEWVRVRQMRLRFDGYTGGAMKFTAAFAVKQRGLRLRVLVPESSARPCYGAGVSQTFRS